VVGHNGGLAAGEGHASLPTLRYADDDALRFARFFGALGEVTLLVEPDADTQAQWARSQAPLPEHQAPTREALLLALTQLTRALQARPASAPPAAVYFVYAGHGLPGRFLLQGDGAAESSLTGRELVSAFAALPAGRATLFLDACRAQSLFSARGADDFSADVAALEASASKVPLGILTAATSTTPAGETPRLRGGYFSHVLASALAGAADADGDHLVRFGELAAFVAFHTERQVGQRPWFEAPAGNLEAVVIDLRTRATVTLGAALEGRFRVEQAFGPIAEVRKAKGRPLELLVPEGDFTVVEDFEGQQRRAVVSGRTQGPLTLEAQAFEPSQAARGDEADEGSFEAPFSSDAVSALSTGYQAGRAPLETQGPFRFALAARYGLSGALNFTGVEHGGELAFSARPFGRLVLGPRAALRTSTFEGTDGPARWLRASLLLEAGLQFAPAPWLELTPLLGLGVKWVWRQGAQATRGDLSQPALAVGLRVAAPLTAHLALDVELRAEGALVALDGVRRLYAEPMGLVGLSWRWR
jgi:hypothetical protein